MRLPHDTHRAAPKTAPGFTLIELLVVMGIIVVLASLLIPMVMRSMRKGVAMKTAADLNTIAIALDAYKADFGDYPRLPVYLSPDPNAGIAIFDVGAATLGKALFGPYGDGMLPSPPNPSNVVDPDDPPAWSTGKAYRPGECVSHPALPGLWVCIVTTTPGIAPPDGNYWAPFNPRDAADGPGFRTRLAVNGVAQGKVWGPYLKPENFKTTGVALNDRDGNPILYFPASSAQANVRTARSYIDLDSQTRVPPTPIIPKYDAENNLKIFRRAGETNDTNSLARMQALLGDFNTDGSIDAQAGAGTEQPAATGAFILWAAGPDGLFGPNDIIDNPASADDWHANRRAVEKCDDVTNFR